MSSTDTRHVRVRTEDGRHRVRVMPPEDYGDIWVGSPKKDHVAYPAPGSRCGCGTC